MQIKFRDIGTFFFFQAEDGIRDAQESRGLGDVYKRQIERIARVAFDLARTRRKKVTSMEKRNVMKSGVLWPSLIHI